VKRSSYCPVELKLPEQLSSPSGASVTSGLEVWEDEGGARQFTFDPAMGVSLDWRRSCRTEAGHLQATTCKSAG